MFGPTTAEHLRGSRGRGTGVGVLVGGFLVLVFGIATVVGIARGGGNDVGVGLALTAIGAGVGVLCSRLAGAGERRAWRRSARLVAFARANGLTVEPEAAATPRPGTPFRNPSFARTRDRIAWTAAGLPAEAADWSTYRGRAGTVHCRYLAVRLDVDAPRATFDCGVRGPARGETLVGGDALGPPAEGRRHRLTCVTASHDRARALFPDEVVALLTDPHQPCNAEVADGWFLAYYRPGKADAERWRHTFALADAVARATASIRAAERPEQPGVAAP